MEYGTGVAIGLYVLGVGHVYYTINGVRIRMGLKRLPPKWTFFKALLWPFDTFCGLIAVILLSKKNVNQ